MKTKIKYVFETKAHIYNMADSIDHILWTLQRSPKTYDLYRNQCIRLRHELHVAELLHKKVTNVS